MGNIEIDDSLIIAMQNTLPKIDRKLALATQKNILKFAGENAYQDLRQKTKHTYKKRTGYGWKSTKKKIATSRTNRNSAYMTYGWRNKGTPDMPKSKKNPGIRPKPATYIGIWGDMGTKKCIKGARLLKKNWDLYRTDIIYKINSQTERVMKEIFSI